MKGKIFLVVLVVMAVVLGALIVKSEENRQLKKPENDAGKATTNLIQYSLFPLILLFYLCLVIYKRKD